MVRKQVPQAAIFRFRDIPASHAATDVTNIDFWNPLHSSPFGAKNAGGDERDEHHQYQYYLESLPGPGFRSWATRWRSYRSDLVTKKSRVAGQIVVWRFWNVPSIIQTCEPTRVVFSAYFKGKEPLNFLAAASCDDTFLNATKCRRSVDTK